MSEALLFAGHPDIGEGAVNVGRDATDPPAETAAADEHHPVVLWRLHLRPSLVIIPTGHRVRIELSIGANADDVWAVVRDFVAGPLRMAPGYVVETKVIDTQDGTDTRVVTFASGAVVRERLVAVDDQQRRIVYAVIGDTMRPDHDNASMQVYADGENRSRFVWIHDVLPDDLAMPLRAAMEQGGDVIKRTLERQD